MMTLTRDDQGPMKGHLYDKPTSDIAPKTHRSLKTDPKITKAEKVGLMSIAAFAAYAACMVAFSIVASPVILVAAAGFAIGSLALLATTCIIDIREHNKIRST